MAGMGHEKVGHTEQGLWHHKGWQLPAYIQHVANDLRESGHDESRAIEMAIGIVRNWAEGHDGHGHKVSAETQAKAVAAIAEWEALKTAAKAKGSHRMSTYTRSFALEDISIRSGGDGRTVDAFATVFDVPAGISDEDGDYEEVNDRAMYNRALSDAAPAGGRQSWRVGVFYNHGRTIWNTPSDLYSVPVGVALDIRPEPRGLFTRTRYHPGEACDRILAGIHEGSLSSYSVSGAYLRSDPPVPRGGFRRGAGGKLTTVRRLEASLREYGPTPFPAYAGAEVVGVRSEQVMTMLSMLTPDERARLIDQFRSGTPIGDVPVSDAPDDSGLVAEDSRRLEAEMRSGRSPKQMIQANRARFITRHEGVGA